MSVSADRLAVDGGRPLRTEPFPSTFLGCSVLGKEELDLLTEVIERRLPFREYGDGVPHMVKDFETESRRYFGTDFALATATGSSSFYCAMAGIGVGPGDEVVIPSYSWFTDFAAPALLGATPVFADIDRSLCMDPDDFARKISPRTKAAIVVHFQGATGNLERIMDIARNRNILIVEDTAQACGASYKGRKLGSLGAVGCFSFQQNKTMSTGDGGLLITNDAHIFERAARFHDLGIMRPSLAAQMCERLAETPFVGCQFRMNEFTGAVALAQLRKLDSMVLASTRRHHKHICNRVAVECPGIQFRQTGDPEGDSGIALYLDLGCPEAAKWFAEALVAEGIRVGPSSSCTNMLREELVLRRKMAHPDMPPFGRGCAGENARYLPSVCPNTDNIIGSLVAVAIGPRYTDADADDIASAIAKVWRGKPSILSVGIQETP